MLLHFHRSATRLRLHTFHTGPSCSTTRSNRTITDPLNLTSLSDRCQPLSHRWSDKDAPDKRSRCRGHRQHVRFAALPRNTMSQSIGECWCTMLAKRRDSPCRRRRCLSIAAPTAASAFRPVRNLSHQSSGETLRVPQGPRSRLITQLPASRAASQPRNPECRPRQ